MQVLKLDSNRIPDAYVEVLCGSMMNFNNKSLRVLSLCGNLITDTGAAHIAELIEANFANLKEIKLSWNNIKARGAVLIGNALGVNN